MFCFGFAYVDKERERDATIARRQIKRKRVVNRKTNSER